jgi:hypothetical protein
MVASFLGLPRARLVDSNRKRFSISEVQSSSPSGHPQLTHRRKAASSASL